MVCQGILFVIFRAPRFKGFQQQDSHELLRHLMDGMKAEEIKVSPCVQLVHLQYQSYHIIVITTASVTTVAAAMTDVTTAGITAADITTARSPVIPASTSADVATTTIITTRQVTRARPIARIWKGGVHFLCQLTEESVFVTPILQLGSGGGRCKQPSGVRGRAPEANTF